MTYNQRVRQLWRDPLFHSCNPRQLMDKKTKKRLEVLRQKVEKTQKLLAAARAQTDEPDEIENLEKQLAQYQTEIAEIKNK